MISNLDSTKVARSTAKSKNWQRPTPCWCTGYWFPHRIGGGACEHSKTRDIHMALRHKNEGALLDASIAHALDYPGKATAAPCPF